MIHSIYCRCGLIISQRRWQNKNRRVKLSRMRATVRVRKRRMQKQLTRNLLTEYSLTKMWTRDAARVLFTQFLDEWRWFRFPSVCFQRTIHAWTEWHYLLERQWIWAQKLSSSSLFLGEGIPRSIFASRMKLSWFRCCLWMLRTRVCLRSEWTRKNSRRRSYS